jgi:hypothetical protein
MVSVSFSFYGKIHKFACKVLSDKFFETMPKCIDLLDNTNENLLTNVNENPQSSTTRTSRSMTKNKRNSHTSRSSSKGSKSSRSSSKNSNSSSSGSKSPKSSSSSSKGPNSSNSSSKSRKSSKKKICSPSSASSLSPPPTKKQKQSQDNIVKTLNNNFQSFTAMQDEKENLNELSLKELYVLASKGEFPKKLFIFKDGRKLYSERLQFFSSLRVFDFSIKNVKTQTIDFQCKYCNKKLQAHFGAIQNLSSHLPTHPDFLAKWLSFFEKKTGKKQLDDSTFDLVRAIISVNLPLAVLENENFAKCLKMELTSVKTFRNSILPRVNKLMMEAIDIKLSNASSISLIVDIWTNKVFADFLALAALIVNEQDKAELLVLGMSPMNGIHTAESVKPAIENIVNSFNFNKNLAKSKLKLILLGFL